MILQMTEKIIHHIENRALPTNAIWLPILTKCQSIIHKFYNGKGLIRRTFH